MKEELRKIRESLDSCQAVPLYPGIELWYVERKGDGLSPKHGPLEQVVQINYCKSGQAAWSLTDGSRMCLHPGDFSLHRMDGCTQSEITFPTGEYSGLVIWIDLREAAADPPELLRQTGLFSETLPEKFCRDNAVSILAENEQTERIFSGFYRQPEELRLPYQKLKVLELLLYLQKSAYTRQTQVSAGQVEIVREIHDQLIRQIGQRITIEELSRQYLINPTTLKTAFKAVYGTSIAAHMKEHRMKMAAQMLRETNLSISEVAQAVGYDSQSKFTEAFKAVFHTLPRDYKRL